MPYASVKHLNGTFLDPFHLTPIFLVTVISSGEGKNTRAMIKSPLRLELTAPRTWEFSDVVVLAAIRMWSGETIYPRFFLNWI